MQRMKDTDGDRRDGGTGCAEDHREGRPTCGRCASAPAVSPIGPRRTRSGVATTNARSRSTRTMRPDAGRLHVFLLLTGSAVDAVPMTSLALPLVTGVTARRDDRPGALNQGWLHMRELGTSWRGLLESGARERVDREFARSDRRRCSRPRWHQSPTVAPNDVNSSGVNATIWSMRSVAGSMRTRRLPTGNHG